MLEKFVGKLQENGEFVFYHLQVIGRQIFCLEWLCICRSCNSARFRLSGKSCGSLIIVNPRPANPTNCQIYAIDYTRDHAGGHEKWHVELFVLMVITSRKSQAGTFLRFRFCFLFCYCHSGHHWRLICILGVCLSSMLWYMWCTLWFLRSS